LGGAEGLVPPRGCCMPEALAGLPPGLGCLAGGMCGRGRAGEEQLAQPGLAVLLVAALSGSALGFVVQQGALRKAYSKVAASSLCHATRGGPQLVMCYWAKIQSPARGASASLQDHGAQAPAQQWRLQAGQPAVARAGGLPGDGLLPAPAGATSTHPCQLPAWHSAVVQRSRGSALPALDSRVPGCESAGLWGVLVLG
jgi:hypothetical protein